MRSSTVFANESNVSFVGDEFVSRAGESLVRSVWASVGAAGDFREFEAKLHELANEAVRRQLEIRLQQIADEHTERLRIDGKLYRQHEAGEVDYHTLCGKVRVRRATYREVGVRNGPTVVPLDLATGVIRQATPALAYSVALSYAAGPMRHYEAQMKAAHRRPPPRATLERMANCIGGCAAQDVVKIEAEIRRDEGVPAEAHAISVSLDRTAVAMAEERPPGEPANSRRKRRIAPYVRKKPDPIDVNWRMLYVGTVSLVDKSGDIIVTRKYHATPEEGPDEITSRMMADLTHWKSQAELSVVVVQDGGPEMWNEMRAALRKAGVSDWIEVLDRYHLNERLSQVLQLVEREASARNERFERWQRQLDADDKAIYRIRTWIDQRAEALGRSQRWYELLGHSSYIYGYQRMMRYASLRRRGLPIGSGAVEGACKSLVAMRAKRSGQRWHQDGLTAVLTLRALEQSDRLMRFWHVFRNRFSANIIAA